MKTNAMIRLTSLLALMLTLLNGCGRVMYDSLRYNQELRCQEMQGNDRNACMRQNDMSYDEYQRQLKEHDERK